MYKVFVNDKPIILTDSLKNDNTFPLYNFNEIVTEEVLHKLQRGNFQGVNLFCRNLTKDWNIFLKDFKVMKAGGGLVINENKDLLFILRANIWDLPKGGVEKDESIEETAIREVEEECGVYGLSIIKPLLTTHHVFYYDEIRRLKVTDWFLMHTKYQEKMIPQLEEGITEVVFKNKEQVATALINSFANIKLVIEEYYKEH
jgi:8-oxo-dGTP pyrophosphatase MutT (NUDIX family)